MRTTCTMKTFALGLTLTLFASAGIGCKSKKLSGALDTDLPPSVIDVHGSMILCPEPPKLYFTRATDLTSVYFDYNASLLRPDAMASLARNAEVMNAKADNTYFRIEGNCDERGTEEYNLALGERRALAVRSYLISLGVDRHKMVTVSFGEGNSVALGSSESAYAEDRRVDFGITTTSM